MIQIAIIEDDPLYSEALIALFEKQTDMQVWLCQSSTEKLCDTLGLDQAPDILLLGYKGAENTLEYLEKIHKMAPELPIILLFGYENPRAIRKAMLMGICGYFYKGESQSQLLKAIHEVIGGNAYLSPKAAKIALEMIRKANDEVNPEQQAGKISARLSWSASQRELNVIRGLIDGKSYKEIAASNFMTIDGVRYYVRSIYPKLGVSTRDQLVRVLTR